MNEEKNKIARENRKKVTGEVFTPPEILNEMLFALNETDWKEGKTFCDQSCGNGNMLVAILEYKLKLGHNITNALKAIYGIDIMRDNIQECRLRLLRICEKYGEIINENHVKIVMKNIVWLNRKRYPTGALEYDMLFNNSPKISDVQDFLKRMKDGDDFEDFPIEEENFTPKHALYRGRLLSDEFN